MTANDNQKAIRVLIVEDQETDRILLTKSIKQSGTDCIIDSANSIDEAILMVKRERYDCILLDYYFPEKNGSDFLRQYAQTGSSGNIIMVTSEEDIYMAVECMKLGASDFLTKSQITPASIAKSLRYILRLKEAREAAEKAEAALFESELKLKNIIARSPVIVFNLDSNGIITLFKGKAAHQLSIKPEDVTGNNIRDFGNTLPIRAEDFAKAAIGIETQFNTEVNGRHFDVKYIPVKNENKAVTGIMGVAIDVTSFKKNEEILINAIESKDLEGKIKQQFLANVSHEIRTPIHSIISLTRFVLNTPLQEEQKNYLELIRKSADNLLDMVNGILDLSKAQAGKMDFESIPFDPKEVIESTLNAFKPQVESKGLKMEIELSDDLPGKLTGDPLRLTQIINNIFGNAVKFTESGTIKFRAVEKERNSTHSVIDFTISDTGIGIPANRLDTIFDAFTQGGSDISRKFGGTGLGLSITRQLIEGQSGTIRLESMAGEGTTFFFSIPYKLHNEYTVTRKEPVTPTTSMTPQLRILVAEDHDISRFIILKMLGEWGFSAEYAVNGTDTVRMAAEKKYDLILMDVEMPDMNGYKATELIRGELSEPNRSTPIIAMTGHTMEGEKEKCRTAGMNDYLSKPFKAEQLKEKIMKVAATIKKEDSPMAGNEIATGTTTKPVNENTEKTNPDSGRPRKTNLQFLREISENNEQFFREFIELFLKNTPKSLADIEDAINNGDWEKLRQASHKVKPSFNYIGMKEMNQLAARIEEMAKQRSGMEQIKSLFVNMKSCCESAYSELEAELNTKTTL